MTSPVSPRQTQPVADLAPRQLGGVFDFFFKDFRLGRKIGIGMGAILVFLLVVAAVAIYGLQVANSDLAAYRAAARAATQMERIEARLLQARLAVRDFLVMGGADSRDLAQRHLAALQQEIGTAQRSATLEGLAQEVDDYTEAFREVVLFHGQREALAAQMNGAGAQAEQILSEVLEAAQAAGNTDAGLLAGRSLRHLLLARLHVEAFLSTGQQEQADRVGEALAAFKRRLGQLRRELLNPALEARGAQAAQAASGYRKAFEDLVKVTLVHNGVVTGTLERIGPAVATQVDAAARAAEERQVSLSRAAATSLQDAVRYGSATALAVVLLGALLSAYIGRAISRPIQAMTAAMDQLARGDLRAEVPAVGRGDELGRMAEALQVFKDNALEVARLKRAQEERDRQAAEEKRRQMLRLADGFEASVQNLIDLVSSAATELQATSREMSSTAEQTSSQSVAVASASEEATANVQTVASAAEELSVSIQEISRQISESNRIAQSAVKDAESTNVQVQGLASAGQNIGEVVSLIRDIAEQTNLLALNATIEAARAGEAGKGFAVVASEVKSLANQTAKATEEIAAQITGMQSATQGTVQAIEEITRVIGQISLNAGVIAGAVEEQKASTQEIARNVQQAAAGTEDVQGNIAQVRVAAEQTGESAGQVLSAAAELSQQSEKLRDEVDRFVGGLRAA